jgi:hypothetical protein
MGFIIMAVNDFYNLLYALIFPRSSHVNYQAIQEITQELVATLLEIRMVFGSENIANFSFSGFETYQSHNFNNIIVPKTEGYS